MAEGRVRTLALFAGSIVVAFALWQLLSTVVLGCGEANERIKWSQCSAL